MDTAHLLARVRTPHKHGRLVLAPSYRAGAFDSHAVDCPFVFRHDDRFWMTFIGFDGVGYRTGLASSHDLIDWTGEGLIIDRGPAGSVTEYNVALTWIVRDNALYGKGELRRIEGRYLGTYHAYPRPGYEEGPAVIGLCWSDDLRAWRLDPPFLTAETGEAWESAGLYKSCLVEHDGTFYLFYNAKNRASDWSEQIGFATSTDLRSWTRHPGNPVVPVGALGAFDDRFASDPCVLRVRDSWAMFYYTLSNTDGHARDSVAFSADLHHWTKSGERLIDVGPPGSIDSLYAHKPSVIAHRGRLYHFYCAVTPCAPARRGDIATTEVRGIGVAMSGPPSI